MNDIFIEGAIPLKDIATVTKSTVAELEAECVELDVFRGRDWAGRVAVTEDDARGLVSGSARRTLEDEVAWRTHLDACESWTRTRDEAVKAAQRDTELAEQRAGRGSPAAASSGLEAARTVGADYEAANPPPTWNGDSSNARRLFTAEKIGLLDKARDLLAGSPR